jgi:hypothetical protein
MVMNLAGVTYLVVVVVVGRSECKRCDGRLSTRQSSRVHCRHELSFIPPRTPCKRIRVCVHNMLFLQAKTETAHRYMSYLQRTGRA